MADYPVSLVHTKVTSVETDLSAPLNPDFLAASGYQSFNAKSSFQSYRDSTIERCKAEYQQVEYVYELAPDKTKHGRVNLLRECRTGAFFAVNSDDRSVRVMSNHCSLRWCPMCSSAKQYFVTDSVTDLLHRMKHPKMITLTLRHTSAPLADQIKQLYESFKRLRKMKPFAKKVTGGVWFFQIKITERTHEWHPHLHMLVDGDYIAQRYLGELWKKASYGSYIVFIKPVKDLQKSAEYVARYAVKPAFLSYYSLSEGVQIITALHGRRICGTWGVGRGTCLSIPKVEKNGNWYRVGNYRTIVELKGVDDHADMILSAWRSDMPLPPGIDMDHIEKCQAVPKPHPPPAAYLPGFYN